jgi:hypothetical protein
MDEVPVMNAALNRFRLGVIAERQFAHVITTNEPFGREQWKARCEHLAERAHDSDGLTSTEQYGRLSVAWHVLEALDLSETDQ